MIKQVIVIRKDLNMRKGKMCAQAAHASMKVFFDRMKDVTCRYGEHGRLESSQATTYFTLDMLSWMQGTFTKIVLGCSTEDELVDLYHKAVHDGIPCSIIEDIGATEFHGVPTKTAIAIGPAQAEDIDPITGHLKPL